MLANLVPLTIMAIAFGFIALLLASDRPASVFVTIAVLGTLVGFGRIALSMASRRNTIEVGQVKTWEHRYALGSYAFSLCVGLLGGLAFLEAEPIRHMLITALLFGYTSGVVARGSCRPIIATTSLMLAALPIIVTIAIRLGTGHLTTAYLSLDIFILVFLVGSIETVRHVYQTILSLLVARAELDRLARRDHLTGLPNRMEIDERLERAAASLRRDRGLLAVHVLDLDGFKAVNDSFGHVIGDGVLEQVADRLRGAIRRGDLVGRLGGDEFVIIQEGLDKPNEAERLASRIIAILSEPYEIGGRTIWISASIGIATNDNEGGSREVLIQRADRSLYEAKAGGGRRYAIDS